MRTILAAVFCFLLQNIDVFAQKVREPNAAPLHKAQNLLTDVMVHDIFSPPVASRIYAYAHLAAYETLAQAGITGVPSLQNRLPQFPLLKMPKAGLDPVVAALEAFHRTGRALVFSEQQFSDSMQALIQQIATANGTGKQLANSLRAGQQIADSILSWAAKDRYKETRSIRRYQLKKTAGTWLPTPPGYMGAIEPHWKQMRPITLDSAAQFRPPLATPYSTDTASAFYKEAFEVYDVCSHLTREQQEIASFWDCNPFHLTMQGHLHFATKKISPGGHWMQIAGLASRMKQEGIGRAALAYTSTAIAIYDAFISCWEEKYNSQLIRPETYINSHISESWRPLLQTPPFPEYPSGHSVVSGAAATVLTQLYGDNFTFVDDSELPYGLPTRRFISFVAASEEAAISRLYGGIHYRPAIENGMKEGRAIGKWVLKRLGL